VIDSTTTIYLLAPAITVITIIVALIQYRQQNNKQEQARFISVYAIELYDYTDKYNRLIIAPLGSKEKTVSLAVALVVENNSGQPIHDFHAKINVEAFRDIDGTPLKTKDEKEVIIADSVHWFDKDKSVYKPFKMLPPGKWLFSIDITDTDGFQGMNLLESTLKYENADYIPVVRSYVDAVSSYEFKDNMRFIWKYECNKNSNKLIKCGK